MKENEYQCAVCKGVFAKEWSDEEALKEAQDNFGEVAKEDCSIVCDDCYNKIMDNRKRGVKE